MSIVKLVACGLPAILCLAGCGSSAPATVQLGKSYTLVDEQGRVAGKAIFGPAGTGRIVDNSGQYMGTISAQ